MTEQTESSRRWNYKFRIDNMLNYDVQILICVRYLVSGEGDEQLVLCSEFLTDDGWTPYEESELLPVDRMPKVSGTDIDYRMLRRGSPAHPSIPHSDRSQGR